MAASMNKVMLIGFLGNDPELKYTPGNRAVCNFRMATDESYKDKKTGQLVKAVEWHRITIWGPQAENCHKYLKKGRMVFIEGKNKTRSYDKNGEKRYTTEIVALQIRFLGGGKKEEEPAKPVIRQPPQRTALEADMGSASFEDDIPEFDDEDMPVEAVG